MTGRARALRLKTGAVLPALGRATARVWSGPEPAARYGEYLCLMHAVVRASVPLLTAAARRCAELGAADPVAGPLAAYLTAHAVEEREHDRWLLDDLRAIGRDPEEPLRRVPPPVVAELVGAQYYWLLHHHPVSLLGYVAVLEQQPGAPELPDRLARLTGLPPRGFGTLRAHVALDPGHRAELDAVIDGLPLSADHEALIAVSALHTVSAATRLFAWLADRRLLEVSAR
ncbi:iron-containing redox enzyme family protein [Streptomyces polygonati]|uniref:Iron-containing redox enzyme family protein n=1 Tax=Streptomyces polygonati TaxID=1617087 RepID=A0ABV8HIR3_9ACTN